MHKDIIFLMIAYLVHVSLGHAASGREICDHSSMNVIGETISECRDSAEKYSNSVEFGSCISQTHWMASWASLKSDCNHRVMNKTLDERLLRLKRSVLPQNKRYFISEMRMQAIFVKGVHRYCLESLSTCQGSMWIPVRAACPGEFYRVRDALGEMINNGELKLPDINKNFVHIENKIPSELFLFADHLCKMPFDVWKDRKPPSDCVKKVLSIFNLVPDICSEKETKKPVVRNYHFKC